MEHGHVHGEGYADAMGRIANPRSVGAASRSALMDLAEGIAERLTGGCGSLTGWSPVLPFGGAISRSG